MTRRRRIGLVAWLLGFRLFASRAEAAEEAERATPSLSFLPFVGVYSYFNVDRKSYRPGPHVGGLLGVRFGLDPPGHGLTRFRPDLSLNVEIAYDQVVLANDSGGTPQGWSPSESFLDIAFSPLFHYPSGSAEFVAGPEIGYFRNSHPATAILTSSAVSGLALGLNVGVFARVNRYVGLGGLVSVEARRYSGGAEHDADLVALTFAALF
jgi:hypothetical protein